MDAILGILQLQETMLVLSLGNSYLHEILQEPQKRLKNKCHKKLI